VLPELFTPREVAGLRAAVLETAARVVAEGCTHLPGHAFAPLEACLAGEAHFSIGGSDAGLAPHQRVA
jgi:hypothetical protein